MKSGPPLLIGLRPRNCFPFLFSFFSSFFLSSLSFSFSFSPFFLSSLPFSFLLSLFPFFSSFFSFLLFSFPFSPSFFLFLLFLFLFPFQTLNSLVFLSKTYQNLFLRGEIIFGQNTLLRYANTFVPVLVLFSVKNLPKDHFEPKCVGFGFLDGGAEVRLNVLNLGR